MTTISERPYKYSFSSNNIRYDFNVTDPMVPGCAVDIEIHYLPVDLSVDTTLITVSPTPDSSGNISFSLDDYLSSIVFPQMPDPAGAVIQPVVDQVKVFYIRFREISTIDQNTDWIDDSANKGFVLLGGVEEMKFRRNNFFANYLADQRPFLTWQPQNKRVCLNQEHFLTYLHTTAETNFSVEVKAVFTDGAISTQSLPSAVGYNKLFRIKAGVKALGLDTISPAKILHYYDIKVVSGSTVLANAFRFYIDYEYLYNGYHDFNFINSIGGIDGRRLTGDFNRNVDVTSDDVEHINDNLNFASAFPSSQFSQANIVKKDTYKGDVGWSKTPLQQEALIELLMSRAIFENIGGRWIRVLNLKKSQDMGAATDKKWSFPLDWTYGYADRSFTPASIILGAGTAYIAPSPPPPPPPAVCTPVSLPSVSLPDAVVGQPYNVVIALTGSAPFDLSSPVRPSGMTITLDGSNVLIGGTPNAAGSGVTISFTINNCTADSATFSDTIDVAAAVTASFGAVSVLSGDSNNIVDQVAIIGAPGSTVTIKLTTYTNTNGGQIRFNGSQVFLDSVVNVVLDASGYQTVQISIQGSAANSSTIIRGIFTITAVSSGAIGTPASFQISKVF